MAYLRIFKVVSEIISADGIKLRMILSICGAWVARYAGYRLEIIVK